MGNQSLQSIPFWIGGVGKETPDSSEETEKLHKAGIKSSCGFKRKSFSD